MYGVGPYYAHFVYMNSVINVKDPILLSNMLHFKYCALI
jgi:hypothetical protein